MSNLVRNPKDKFFHDVAQSAAIGADEAVLAITVWYGSTSARLMKVFTITCF